MKLYSWDNVNIRMIYLPIACAITNLTVVYVLIV